jgi:phosphoribosylamine--glycine ligase
MGSHWPAVLPPGTSKEVLEKIVMPTIRGMAEENRPYRGILYVGLMLTREGPKVLEFNCRLGDPETQSILLRLDDDLAGVLRAAADGRLTGQPLTWRREAAACVVLASEGYPASARKGVPIHGISEAEALPGVTVYHAGTAERDGQLVTAGGRVLSVCGRGAGLGEAIATAYAGVERIHFEGMQFRSDIGQDSLRRLEERHHGD